MANLATIQKIAKVREIDSTKRDICELRFEDSLWHVVGAKNTYNVGQRVVFFAPGCVIPKGTAAYAHLCDFARKNAKGMEVTDDYIRVHASSVGIKHKTHGLVLPLSLFPELQKMPVRADITERIGVISEKALNTNVICASYAPAKLPQPDWIPARKFVDLRDCPKMFDKYQHSRFYGELMIDGSIPVAVYCVSDKYDADRFGVCVFGNKIKRPRYSQAEIKRLLYQPPKKERGCLLSLWELIAQCCQSLWHWAKHTDQELQEEADELESMLFEHNDLWNTIEIENIEPALSEWQRRTGRSIVVFFEWVGPDIQGNPERYPDHRLYASDVYDLDAQKWLLPKERELLLDGISKRIRQVVKCYYDYPFAGSSVDSTIGLVADICNNRNTRKKGIIFKSSQEPYMTFKVLSDLYGKKTKTRLSKAATANDYFAAQERKRKEKQERYQKAYPQARQPAM